MSIDVKSLKSMPLFKSFTEEQLDILSKVMIRRKFQPGQLIFLEGDTSKGLWFIIEGRVRIIKHSQQGRVQALCLVNSGKCFGGCPLFDADVNPASAEAIDDVTLFIIPQTDLKELINETPPLAIILFHVYSNRVSHLAHLSEGLGTWTAASRINDNLIRYLNVIDSAYVVQLTHEKLATLAGTGREVVTRHLTKLEKRGIIQNEPGQITILALDELSSMCIASF